MALTLATVESQLAEVNSAITSTLTSQEYRAGTRGNRRPDIQFLFDERARLELLCATVGSAGRTSLIRREAPI